MKTLAYNSEARLMRWISAIQGVANRIRSCYHHVSTARHLFRKRHTKLSVKVSDNHRFRSTPLFIKCMTL